MENNLPQLTEDQKKLALEQYAEMDFSELVKLVFRNDNLDGRSLEGKALKMFLTGESKLVNVSSSKTTKGDIVLNDFQKKFVETNCNSMKVLELARTLFPDAKVTLSSREFKAVYKHTKEINPEEMDVWDEPVESREYKPPIKIQDIVGKVNSYVLNINDHTRPVYDLNNLKSSEEKNLRALLGFMKTPRFRYQASQYSKKADRILFESTFIRFVHDKSSELIAEEVDMYIAAAAETINTVQIERQIQSLEQSIENMLDEGNESGRAGKISMPMVDLVNSSREKLDKSKMRLKGLIESLSGSRAKRNENRIQQNASIINLTDAWTAQESREAIISLGVKEKLQDEEEFNRLKNMDDVIALIAGMTAKEAKS